MPSLQQQLGQIDIYFFDRILRSNIMPGMRVLDAGCGPGRNLVYLLREGYEVFASDQNPEAITRPALSSPPSPFTSQPTTSASKPSSCTSPKNQAHI
jgi:2-polyprenyl-3-methyl-5-hydroxy-6-metoxy-1,4-benzoquinol methylase